jgi:hypothetical protein
VIHENFTQGWISGGAYPLIRGTDNTIPASTLFDETALSIRRIDVVITFARWEETQAPAVPSPAARERVETWLAACFDFTV